MDVLSHSANTRRNRRPQQQQGGRGGVPPGIPPVPGGLFNPMMPPPPPHMWAPHQGMVPPAPGPPGPPQNPAGPADGENQPPPPGPPPAADQDRGGMYDHKSCKLSDCLSVLCMYRPSCQGYRRKHSSHIPTSTPSSWCSTSLPSLSPPSLCNATGHVWNDATSFW